MTIHTVRAHSRIACCLLDMNGERGRVDGTLGFSLERPFVEVVATPSDVLEIDVDDAVAEAVRAGVVLAERIAGAPMKVRLQLPYWIRPHVGLGHKTQTVLAVAAASLNAASVNYSLDELSRQSGRGGTSGAGVHTFLGGGIVVDGGHRFGAGAKSSFAPSSATPDVGPPPLIARIHPPADLRVITATVTGIEGASGDAEVNYFEHKFPLRRADTDALIANVFMRLLPALIEGDTVQIDAGIEAIQLSTFKKSIWAAQPYPLQQVRQTLRESGIIVGLSSMGSTMYTLTSEADAARVARAYRHVFTNLCVDAGVQTTQIAQSGAGVEST